MASASAIHANEMFGVPIVPAVELQTPFGSAIPPAPGHSPEYAVTTHIPMWETVAQFSAKVDLHLWSPAML